MIAPADLQRLHAAGDLDGLLAAALKLREELHREVGEDVEPPTPEKRAEFDEQWVAARARRHPIRKRLPLGVELELTVLITAGDYAGDRDLVSLEVCVTDEAAAESLVRSLRAAFGWRCPGQVVIERVGAKEGA